MLDWFLLSVLKQDRCPGGSARFVLDTFTSGFRSRLLRPPSGCFQSCVASGSHQSSSSNGVQQGELVLGRLAASFAPIAIQASLSQVHCLLT